MSTPEHNQTIKVEEQEYNLEIQKYIVRLTEANKLNEVMSILSLDLVELEDLLRTKNGSEIVSQRLNEYYDIHDLIPVILTRENYTTLTNKQIQEAINELKREGLLTQILKSSGLNLASLRRSMSTFEGESNLIKMVEDHRAYSSRPEDKSEYLNMFKLSITMAAMIVGGIHFATKESNNSSKLQSTPNNIVHETKDVGRDKKVSNYFV